MSSNHNDRLRGHQLLTKEIAKRLPGLLQTDGQGGEAIVQAKFFTPDSSFTWYALEYDPVQRLFFGWVIDERAPHFAELGSFSRDELEEVRGPLGLPIERDLWFKPKSLKEIQAQHLKQ